MSMKLFENREKINRASKISIEIFPSLSIKNNLQHCNNEQFDIGPPITEFYSENFQFSCPKHQEFFEFHEKNYNFFQEILNKTYVAIAIDSNYSYYQKSFVNLVKLTSKNSQGQEGENINNQMILDEDLDSAADTHEEKFKICFLTNYSLIKKFKDRDIDQFSVYFIPHSSNQKLCDIFKKLEYIIHIKPAENSSSKQSDYIKERENYFEDLRLKHSFEKININKSFLKLRDEFLSLANREKYNHLFSNPIDNSIADINPSMDIMVLDFHEINQLWTSPKILNLNNVENSYPIINQINVDNLQDLYKKFPFDLKSNNNNQEYPINLISYFNSEDLNKRINLFKNIDEVELARNLVNFHHVKNIENKLTINKGILQIYGNLCVGSFNFSKTFPGMMIYSNDFSPLGIAVTSLNDNFSNIFKSPNNPDLKNNFNFILPFSNMGVESVFKKFLDLDVKLTQNFKKCIFAINKLSKDENIRIKSRKSYPKNIDEEELNIKRINLAKIHQKIKFSQIANYHIKDDESEETEIDEDYAVLNNQNKNFSHEDQEKIFNSQFNEFRFENMLSINSNNNENDLNQLPCYGINCKIIKRKNVSGRKFDNKKNFELKNYLIKKYEKRSLVYEPFNEYFSLKHLEYENLKSKI